jgi:hypothetical protein
MTAGTVPLKNALESRKQAFKWANSVPQTRAEHVAMHTSTVRHLDINIETALLKTLLLNPDPDFFLWPKSKEYCR